ncbi:mucin-2-like [Mytilus californianus]|uniref:mucin-2-like n=1 Tax=Mytilus californianus TaxID=6549 RepID=UPI002246652B|nr:mucin-2-like [Mytilus californianus]
MNVALKTESVDSIVVKLYNDNVLVYEETVKAQPNGIVELEFIKPQLADKITLTIIPDQTPNATPVVKTVTVEACIKALTTGQPATTPTSSPVITSGTPSTASTPTTGTQAGAPGTSPPLIQTTQPSVTTGPASTTAGLEKCPDDATKGPLNFETVTSSSNPDGAENALTPSGWKPSAEDEKPVLELSTSDSNPIMNVALKTESVDSIVVKLYNDNVLVYEETVKAQPNGIVELEFIKPQLADKITLTIIPDQTPNATPVVKSVTVEACIKVMFSVALTTGQPATTPTSSPVITSGTPSTASTPTTGTQAGAPGTSPPLIQTTQPSVTTGPASTTAGLEKCPDDSTKGPLNFETVTSSSNPDGAENALTPSGWKPSAGDEKPVLELSTSDSNPIMNVALVTQFVDSIVVKLYNDNVLVYEETVKAQPNGIVELEFIKPLLADNITLTIIPDQTPNATPVVKSVIVEACVKAMTTGQPATTPTSSPVITSATPSTASTPTSGTQAGAPGTSPPLIQTTQPSVTTGPASTTAGLENCPDDAPKGPLNFVTVTSSSNPDGAENAFTPSGWKPSAEDEKPVLELSTSDSNPIMNVALVTQFVDSIVVKLYNDNVLVYEETVKAQPNGIVELEFIKPQLADKITLTIIPDQTPNATPVVKSVTVEACIKALTTGQPATTPTSSPVITSGTPSTASTPTTGTQAGAPGTSPPLIQTTQPSLTTGPASTTAGLGKCPDDTPKGPLNFETVTSSSNPDGAENALTPSGWKPSAEDEKPVLELSTSDSNPIMNVALETQFVDSIVVKLYNDNVLVYEETVKAQPNGIVELEFIKPQLADKITLTIIPDQTPNATPVVKSVTVEACIKALTTGQPATTPTSSPVITSGTPSTASTPTTGTQAGAPGTSPPLIQTTQPSLTTGPASTTAGLGKCPDDTPKGPLNFETVTSSSNPDGAENALTPSGWKPSAEDEKPVLELSTSNSNPIMNVALETEFVDSIVVKLYNDNVLVYEETVKAQPNGIVELELIKPLLADKITLTIIPDQTPNATPVVKSVTVEACIKAVTTGQPATTPTSSPVITSGTPSTASTPTTGTQAGAPGTSPPLIQTTQPSVTTGPASTTAGLGKCPDDTPKGPLNFETVTSSSNPDGAENALTPSGWKPLAEDEKPVLELSTSDSNPIMNVALETEFVDSIVVKLYNDNVLVYEETVKAQPNGIVELELIKPLLADKITLTIIPDQTPNATPVLKSVTVEACIKAVTTGQPATTPTSSPVITSGTPSTASTPTTGTQAGAPGTSPPLIQTTQPSVTTGPASTTAGLGKCPDDTPKGPLNFETVTSSSNPDGAENALTPSGWKPSAEDEKPVLELSTSDSNPIMNVALETEFVDSIVVKLYNDNVLVYEETVKAQPNGIVELELIKPLLADKITLTIIPDQTPNATPVVKSVTVEACIKAVTTGQPATTPTSSPVITSGTPSTASTPTTGTQAGAPGTSPPLIQTTQPSVTTGPASTTAGLGKCPDDTSKGPLNFETVTSSSNPDGAENALTPSGWNPSAEDEKPVLELSTSDSNPIMNVALETEFVDSIVIKLYNDNVLVYEETVKAQPNGIVELELIKPLLADKITLTIIPDQTPNATPVVKSVTVEACIKAVTTGQPATTPTSSPVITSGTPSTASTPTTGTQAGAPGTSPPLIQTTQPSVTTGPASTTAGLGKCPDGTSKGPLNFKTVTSSSNPDGAENALTPSGWNPSAEDEKPVLELSTSDSNPIMNVALETEFVDSIVIKLYNDNVLVYEETVKAQPNGIVELELIKPLLADKITLTIIPDQTPNATPVVKSVTVEACIKAVTTGQPATTPTSSPVITSGTPSTASTPTTGTQAGAPGTSPPLIQTTQPSVTTGPASTTAGLGKCPDDTPKGPLNFETVTSSSNQDGAENALTSSGWKPSAEDEKPVLELSTSDSNPIMNVALETEFVDSIVVKLYNDNVLVYEETVKAQPNGIVELELIKPLLADKITLTIIPDQTPNATPVLKSVTVEACIKAVTTGQPATTPTSSPVITSGTPSTASTPTTGTQAGAPGTSPPLIQTTQPSVTTGPASTTAGLGKCPDDTSKGPLNFETVTSSSNPDGAENALTPSGWKPSAEDERPVLELSTSDSNPIMNVPLETEFVDSIVIKLYNDNVLVYEETVKAQPNGIVELELIKPLLADKITLTIVPDQTPNATPVVKSVTVEACIKAVTTGQPATTPTSSPVITSGTPSTASSPTTGTQAGAPGTSPPLIQTTQPSVTTGPASTTAAVTTGKPTTAASSSPSITSGPSSTTSAPTTTPGYCQFSQDKFVDNFGYEQIGLVGFIEKDDTAGITSEEEKVYIDSSIDAGVVVVVGCSNCTCEGSGMIRCVIGECKECKYSNWGEWSPCSRDCDVGSMSRSRTKLSLMTPEKCPDDLVQTQDCNIDNCPMPTTVELCSAWDDWTECSVGTNDQTCIEGTKSRQRNCTGKIDKEILSCSNDCPEVLECKDPRILLKEPRCEMSCFTLQYPETCSEDEDFEPRCGCKEGYVIDEATDDCVPVENCVCYKSDGGTS